MAMANAAVGETLEYVRNAVEDFYNAGTIVDGAPANLTPGATYFPEHDTWTLDNYT